MFCSGCGSRLLTAAKFCHDCGLTIGLKDDDSLCVAEVETESSERKRHQSTPLTFEEYHGLLNEIIKRRLIIHGNIEKEKERNEARGLLVGSL